jgi:para-nitrobenzyl esterase
MKTLLICALLMTLPSVSRAADIVSTDAGSVQGMDENGIRAFKGVPFAAPPVGALRWKPPQPVPHWEGVRMANQFGPRAMQLPLYGDMHFRSNGMSEDCLYLNIWTPAKSADEKLPVLVYFFGGGFKAGDGSEGRYDGESMAKKGIVAVTVNYRLGVFGFLALPELTKESPHHASGNYGFLDQNAAMQWVRRNIAAFGGDPARVTIAGESAGSISVSAQMASPLSRGLMARAIGESGSLIGTLPPVSKAEAEQAGVQFAATLGLGSAPTLAALRALPAQKLLDATGVKSPPHFPPVLDGWFLTKPPADAFASGEGSAIPLLAGVNSQEGGYEAILGRDKPTVENYRKALQRLYPDSADKLFSLYPAAGETEVMDAAQALASDRFISYGTWKWVDLVTAGGAQPAYYYLYAHPRPPMRPEMGNAVSGQAGGVIKNIAPGDRPPPARGAVHSSEIEYALGNLDQNEVYAWTPLDYQISKNMQEYFANFIKTGDPNGSGLPPWPKFATGRRLVIDAAPHPESMDILKSRYAVFGALRITH